MDYKVCQIADERYMDWKYVSTGGPVPHCWKYKVEKNKTENICGAAAETPVEAYKSFNKIISGLKECTASNNVDCKTLVGKPMLHKVMSIWDYIVVFFGAIGNAAEKHYVRTNGFIPHGR